jgi:hypothetical protein
MIRWPILLALGAALAASAAAAGPKMQKVPVRPAVEYREPKGLIERLTGKSRRACVRSERIAGAIVSGDRTIDLVLSGGERWRMRFKDDCSALSYYQGFYYRQTQAGRLCAGRDAIKARSGVECPIASLSPLKADKKKR